MRFTPTSAILALPLLAAADSPDYQAQFQEYLGQAQGYYEKFASRIPSPNKYDPVAAAEAKLGAYKVDIIGLDNWKEVLYEPVTPTTTTPEESWVLVTGGNKTCFGHCGQVDAAFNETAGKFALEPNTPHMAILNCDHQPVLCNAWSAPVGALWVFEMLPEPAPINIWTKRLNLTTTTSEDLVQLQKDGYKTAAKELDGIFHPFKGPLAQNGLSIPAGYVLWAFGLLPSWAFMLFISLFSRRMMSGRMDAQQGATRGGPRPAPTGQSTARK